MAHPEATAGTFASHDGVRLAYTQVGQGRPLLCLPGGPGRASEYLEDLGGLSAERTLVRLDPRATGRSEVPPDPASLRFDLMAADIEALRQHLDLETVDVLGHSAGTLIAQAWASAHPSRVASLTLVTPSDRLQGGDRHDVPQIRELFKEQPWYAEAAEAQAALATAPASQRATLERTMRPFFYGRWDARTQAHAATADRQSSKRAQLGFGVGIEPADIEVLVAGLRSVLAPVLVVLGERDATTGVAAGHLVASCFPNARTTVIASAGHFPWVDEPAAFQAAVIGFLEATQPA